MASPIFSLASHAFPWINFPQKTMTIPRFQGVVIGERCEKNGCIFLKSFGFGPSKLFLHSLVMHRSCQGRRWKWLRYPRCVGEKWHHGWILDDEKSIEIWARNLEGPYKKGDLFLVAMAFWSIFHIFFFEGVEQVFQSFFFRFELDEGWKGERDGQYQIIGVPFCGHGWSPVVFAEGSRWICEKTPSVIPYTLSLNLWV